MTVSPLKLKRQAKKTILSAGARSAMPKFLVDLTLKRLKIGFRPASMKSIGKVSLCNYKGGADGACCISIDFDHPFQHPEKRSINPKGAIALVELSEKYNVPLTWAICGAPVLRDREAYGRILESTVQQEIGVHTFSHRDLTDPSCSDDEARSEIIRCIETLGIDKRPTTFVFPWNRESKYNILVEQGFTAYRSKNRFLGYPMKEHGLWNIPPVYYLDEKSYGAADLVKRFVDFSVSRGCVLHLWSHPWSLSVNGDVRRYVEDTLEPIFQYLAEKRDEHHLWLCTMGELASYCEARENCEIFDYWEDSGNLGFKIRCSMDDKRFDLPPTVTFMVPIPHQKFSVRINGIDETRSAKLVTNSNGSNGLLFGLTFDKPEYTLEIGAKGELDDKITKPEPLLGRA